MVLKAQANWLRLSWDTSIYRLRGFKGKKKMAWRHHLLQKPGWMPLLWLAHIWEGIGWHSSGSVPKPVLGYKYRAYYAVLPLSSLKINREVSKTFFAANLAVLPFVSLKSYSSDLSILEKLFVRGKYDGGCCSELRCFLFFKCGKHLVEPCLTGGVERDDPFRA